MEGPTQEDAWAELDAAMALIDEGRLDDAERAIRVYLVAHPDDVAGEAALQYLDDVRHGRETEVGADAVTPRGAVPLRCVRCGNSDHQGRHVLLNSRWMTFFGFDALNRSAECVTCRTCGYIHWFGDGTRGVYQALHPLHPSPRLPDTAPDPMGACMICGHDVATTRSQLMNTPLMSFFGLDFLNERAHSLMCVRCGFMHWSFLGNGPKLPSLSWRPPEPPLSQEAALERRESCAVCMSEDLEARTAMLNSRVLTRFNLDWLNRVAIVVRCRPCGTGSWYMPVGRRVTE